MMAHTQLHLPQAIGLAHSSPGQEKQRPVPNPRPQEKLRQLRCLLSILLLFLLLLGCSGTPTPYQPLDENGGYEDSRLQERVLRVSFKGNRYTQEGDIIDFLLLRSAELTIAHGFTHFKVVKDYGRTQLSVTDRGPRVGLGVGFGAPRGSSFWGLGLGAGSPSNLETQVDYHLAMFVVHMLLPEEINAETIQVYNAEFLQKSLTPKKEESIKKAES